MRCGMALIVTSPWPALTVTGNAGPAIVATEASEAGDRWRGCRRPLVVARADNEGDDRQRRDGRPHPRCPHRYLLSVEDPVARLTGGCLASRSSSRAGFVSDRTGDLARPEGHHSCGTAPGSHRLRCTISARNATRHPRSAFCWRSYTLSTASNTNRTGVEPRGRGGWARS